MQLRAHGSVPRPVSTCPSPPKRAPHRRLLCRPLLGRWAGPLHTSCPLPPPSHPLVRGQAALEPALLVGRGIQHRARQPGMQLRRARLQRPARQQAQPGKGACGLAGRVGCRGTGRGGRGRCSLVGRAGWVACGALRATGAACVMGRVMVEAAWRWFDLICNAQQRVSARLPMRPLNPGTKHQPAA
jgi:hypothetical protein